MKRSVPLRVSPVEKRRRLRESDFGHLPAEPVREKVKTAALYVRVSEEDSVTSNLSIPSQIKILEQRAEQKNFKIVGIYKEEGVSARTDRRPALQRMIRDAFENDPPPFDYIMVHSLSRLWRNVKDAIVYEDEWLMRGVRIDSATQDFADDLGGYLGKGMSYYSDHVHSIRTSTDVRRAMIELAEGGMWPGGVPPHGYRLVPHAIVGKKVRKKLEIDPQEAEDIKTIYELALYGDGISPPLGIKSIVKWLNDKGVRTRFGSRWSVGKIHKILLNPTYYGKRRYNEDARPSRFNKDLNRIVVTQVPAIISEEQFEKVQEMLELRAPQAGGKRVSSPLLLSGLAFCSCGNAMSLSTGKGRRGGTYRYYKCSNFLRTGHGNCRRQVVPEHVLDDAIIGALANEVLDPQRLACVYAKLRERRIIESNENSSSVGSLQEKLDGANNKIRKIIDFVAQTDFSNEDFLLVEKINILQREANLYRDELRKALRALEENPEASEEEVSAFCDQIHTLLFGENRALAKIYISKIVKKIVVSEEEIRMFGHYETISDLARGGTPEDGGTRDRAPGGRVHGYVRRWCSLGDSNPCFRRERATS